VRRRECVAEITARHLRATKNPAVMWGDVHLLHEVARLAGLKEDGPPTQKRVLDAIDRSHRGVLVKGRIRGPGGPRIFWLSEACGKAGGKMVAVPKETL
jgi:hypothetical protein